MVMVMMMVMAMVMVMVMVMVLVMLMMMVRVMGMDHHSSYDGGEREGRETLPIANRRETRIFGSVDFHLRCT